MKNYSFLLQSLINETEIQLRPEVFPNVKKGHFLKGGNRFIVAKIEKGTVDLIHEGENHTTSYLHHISVDACQKIEKRYQFDVLQDILGEDKGKVWNWIDQYSEGTTEEESRAWKVLMMYQDKTTIAQSDQEWVNSLGDTTEEREDKLFDLLESVWEKTCDVMWGIVEQYHPNYHNSSLVALNNTLAKRLEGEELSINEMADVYENGYAEDPMRGFLKTFVQIWEKVSNLEKVT